MLGLLDDISSITTDHSRKIPQWIRFLVQIVAGIYFSVWLGSADISTPYRMLSVLVNGLLARKRMIKHGAIIRNSV
ncbi:unnamed protein product [Urochloa humidicola]